LGTDGGSALLLADAATIPSLGFGEQQKRRQKAVQVL